ncbi:MAG: hypothetical protein Phog2KO_11860 [Phototrophicaceae bacterium]
MNRLFVIIVIGILVLGFVGSSYAAYNGVGLTTSGTGTSSRGVLFVFPGGGPGFGK